MKYIEFDESRPMDLVLLGRVAIDFNPAYNDQVKEEFKPVKKVHMFEKFVGGSPANIAVGVTKHGLKAGFIGKVSDDQFGEYVVDYFDERGIDTSQITKCTNGEKLGLTFTEMLSPKESSILMYRNRIADLQLHVDDIHEDYIKNAKAILISGTALAESPSREAAIKAVEAVFDWKQYLKDEFGWEPDEENEEDQNIYNTEVKVGHYSDYDVYPTCGLATSQAIVGEVDDPRYFSHPDRINAGILWFTKGYIEYMIPNLLPSATKIDQITVSLEISSEAPGINNDWPSDISILLNDVKIGTWTSPGDYGDVQGIFTPDWWFPNWNQYGLLKMIVINKKGTFVDGLKISNVTINEFNLDYKSTVRFKFEIEEDAKNVGGITIFGSEFGNYNQDIKVRIAYSPMEIAKK